ncbi:MAG: hypothetical protein JW819_04145 [Candidatus Krumholzibacteriota bacterium]|nr:hypothetical protein [Candidatus Krumholzibacteriota bacterium]
MTRSSRTLHLRISSAAAFLAALAAHAAGGETPWRGSLALWAGGDDREPAAATLGARYVPELYLSLPAWTGATVDVDVGGETWRRWRVRGSGDGDTAGETRLYRAWLRLAGDRAEARLGLQRISFGPAALLRPHMWFDRVDARDPLSRTPGVTGLLLRAWIAERANVWLWGLLDNDDPKGWEQVPTVDDEPEVGGRLQVPLLGGELAVSAHRRMVDWARLPLPPWVLPPAAEPEQRYGVDGRWDLGVGFWAEGVLQRQHGDLAPARWQRFATLGADYTFGLGDGLTVLGEHFVAGQDDEALGGRPATRLSALSLRYPLGLMDTLQLMVFRDWESGDGYHYFRWERRGDRWRLDLSAWSNPEGAALLPGAGEAMSGLGGRVMVIYDH